MGETVSEFVPNQLDLISSGQTTYIFDELLGDYVRVAVFDDSETWVVGYEYQTNIDFNGDYIEYTIPPDAQEVIPYPNPDTHMLYEHGLVSSDDLIPPQDGDSVALQGGNPETAQAFCQYLGHDAYFATGVNSTTEIPAGTTVATFSLNDGNWTTTILQNSSLIFSQIECIDYNNTYPTPVDGSSPQVNIYRSGESIYFKPNEILSENQTAGGNYQLKFDFLRNFFDDWYNNFTIYTASTGFDINIPINEDASLIESDIDDLVTTGNISQGDADEYMDLVTFIDDVYMGDPNFYIKQISASRKEIRLYGRYGDNTNLYFDDMFMSELVNILGSLEDDCGTDGAPNCYGLNYVLNIGQGKIITINNYAFDQITDPEHPSLILRLNTPLPDNIFELYAVNIERKLLDSQTENIIYVSNISSMTVGESLKPDFDFNSELYNDTITDTYQNQLQLNASASINQETFDEIALENANEYKNLNIDFSNFKNHVFFGSAASKLSNFKAKVVTIENHLRGISSSLALTGSHVEERRKTLFNDITKVKMGFTPYEKFLYFDNQITSTGSAPGIGPNLIDSTPISERSPTTILPQYEGIKLVYKHTSKNAGQLQDIYLFAKKYRVEDAPFFNTDKPIYLSFLIKGTDGIATSATGTSDGLKWTNMNQYNSLPSSSFGGNVILNPSIKHNEYRRHIYVASQSYWRPSQTGDIGGDVANIYDWRTASSQFEILSGSNITGSYPIYDSSGQIGELLYPTMYNTSSQYGYLDTITERSGSILPSGELFNIRYHSGSNTAGAATSSFTTDIFITTKNPKSVPPFSLLYPTGSSEWISWYDEQYTSASNYDADNIHSLNNTLPTWVEDGADTAVLKDFVHMWGEQFDLTKNHIDNFSNIHKRKYTKFDSVPNNLLPIIGNNLGWEFINPYSSSLSEYFLNATYGQHNVSHVVDDVWNRVMNNLIYIYKTKGTQNSIGALLNSYGIPPDLIKIRETVAGDGNALATNIPIDEGVEGSGIDGVFYTKPDWLSGLMFGPNHGTLKLPWNAFKAAGNAIEFLIKPQPLRRRQHAINTQTLMLSSGSDSQRLWDLRLIPSSSYNNFAKVEFRLNNSPYGSGSISDNAVSMSTSYIKFKDYDYSNILLQSMTASVSGTGVQDYRLYIGSLDTKFDTRITNYQIVSMSVSGGFAAVTASNAGDGKGDLAYQANFNFMGTGSYITGSNNTAISGNLIIGDTFSGSIAEVRLWDSTLSSSKFRLHIMDKTSVVGNNINSYKDDLTYRFKLNENYTSGSNNRRVINNMDNRMNTDYTRTVPYSENKLKYSVTKTILYKFAPKSNQEITITDNKIIIKPDEIFVNPLSPYHSSVQKIENTLAATRIPTNKIKISKSPSAVIDEYISSQIAGMDAESKYADPRNIYSGSYDELDTFREDVLKGVVVDVNRYINDNSKIFNNSFINSIKNLLPAKSEIDEIGVVIESDMLHKSKFPSQTIKIDPKYNKFDFAVGYLDDNMITGKWVEKRTNADKLKIKDQIELVGKLPLISPANIDITKLHYSGIDSSLLPNIGNFILSGSSLTKVTSKLYFRPIGNIDVYDENNIKFTNKLLNQHVANISFESGSYNAFKLNQSVQTVHDIIIDSTSALNIVSKLIDTKYTSIILSGSNLLPAIHMHDVNPNPVSALRMMMSGSGAFKLNSKLIDDKKNTLFFSGSIFNTSMKKVNEHLIILSGSDTFKLNSKFISDKNNTLFFSGSIANPDMEKINEHLIILSGSDTFKLNSKLIDDKNNTLFFSGSIANPNMKKINEHLIILSGSDTFKLNSKLIDDKKNTLFFSGSIANPDMEHIKIKSFMMSGSSKAVKLTSVYMGQYSASTAPFRTKGYYSRLPWEDEYGNEVKVLSGRYRLNTKDKNLDINWDSGVYNKTFVYYTIGDIEYVSQSARIPKSPGGVDGFEGRLYTGYEFTTEYSNHNYFKRRMFVDEGKGYGYRGYINGESDHRIDARPMGRTAYFATSSTNEILYPDNHYIHFPTSKEGSKLFYIGTQFESGSFSTVYPVNEEFDPPFKPWDPLPSVPFYTYKVDGAGANVKLEVVNKNTIQNKKNNKLFIPKSPNGGGEIK